MSGGFAKRFVSVALPVLVTAGLGAAAPTGAGATTTTTPVVLIIMENHGYSGIVGNPDAPYINATGQFACGGTHPGLLCGQQFTNFSNPEPRNTGPDGYAYPSIAAYIGLTSANLLNFTAANCGGSLSKPKECFKDGSQRVIPSDNPQNNLFRELEGKGVTWGAYAEGMNSNCSLGNNNVSSTGGSYMTRHFPVVYYGNVTTPCATKAVPYVKFSAPAPSSLPQFSFITPDSCSDMHDDVGCVPPKVPTDCTAKTGSGLPVCIGDDWLAKNVPPLLSKAIVIVTWDEGGSANRLLLVMNGPGVPQGSQNAKAYTFGGLLLALESRWGLACISGDGVWLYGHKPGSCGATPVPLPA